MSTMIISCEMLKGELSAALGKAKLTLPVIWVPTEYHNDPNKLREKLQHEVDNAPPCENILLVYGSCGLATVGLKATTADLFIPKVEDCIEIMLSKENQKFVRKARTYFLSKGWLESSNNILHEHERALEKYGEVRTKRIFKAMLKEYNYLMFIDTGISDSRELCSHTAMTDKIASTFDLEVIMEKNDMWLLDELITKHNSNHFIYIPKGQEITMDHFSSVSR
ncbi:DUF1638 domain-containing protein [Dehalobacter sp. DCM]|uniref:DUF1638 domain-containing protein n=1 Tax=Dehalobacter sp. DCM TaxID=2907827 RepID=UPI0030816F06|nr:DUF1638 domain-containing protein [Dehalobacter sp. DCM]